MRYQSDVVLKLPKRCSNIENCDCYGRREKDGERDGEKKLLMDCELLVLIRPTDVEVRCGTMT